MRVRCAHTHVRRIIIIGYGTQRSEPAAVWRGEKKIIKTKRSESKTRVFAALKNKTFTGRSVSSRARVCVRSPYYAACLVHLSTHAQILKRRKRNVLPIDVETREKWFLFGVRLKSFAVRTRRSEFRVAKRMWKHMHIMQFTKISVILLAFMRNILIATLQYVSVHRVQ